MESQIDWEDLLKRDGLSMSQGSEGWLVYVENTDIHQRERPRPNGPDGGLLSREYRLGQRQEVRQGCAECGKSFSANHSDRKFCGQACQKRNVRKRSRDSEATNATV